MEEGSKQEVEEGDGGNRMEGDLRKSRATEKTFSLIKCLQRRKGFFISVPNRN